MNGLRLRWPGFKYKAFTISYDDGNVLDLKLIKLMNEYHIKGTFNLNASAINTEYHVTSSDLEEFYIQNPNVEIAAHGYHHGQYWDLKEHETIIDIVEDIKYFENVTKDEICGFAYPFGANPEVAVNTLRSCGILYSREVAPTLKFSLPDDFLHWHPTCHHNHPELMKLADKFLNEPQLNDTWGFKCKLFYVWGHSYEFGSNNNWNVIESLFKTVGNRDDVYYATNKEICEYVNAFKSLRISLNGKILRNTSPIALYICYKNKQLIINGGEQIKL